MEIEPQHRVGVLVFISEIVGPSSKVSHGDFVRIVGRLTIQYPSNKFED
jgi:hypothetical protein